MDAAERRLLRFGILFNLLVLVCGLCFLVSSIGLNFVPGAEPAVILTDFMPVTPTPVP